MWDPSSLQASGPFLVGSGFPNLQSRKTQATQAKGREGGYSASTERKGWRSPFPNIVPTSFSVT